MKVFTPVQVKWIDSLSEGGWQSREKTPSYKDMECESVGMFVEKNKKTISIVQSKGIGGNSTAELLTIPLAAVKGVKRLK